MKKFTFLVIVGILLSIAALVLFNVGIIVLGVNLLQWIFQVGGSYQGAITGFTCLCIGIVLKGINVKISNNSD